MPKWSYLIFTPYLGEGLPIYRLESGDQKLKLELSEGCSPGALTLCSPTPPSSCPDLGLFDKLLHEPPCLLSKTSQSSLQRPKARLGGSPESNLQIRLKSHGAWIQTPALILRSLTCRNICLKLGYLNLHPTHFLKSQLVLKEVDDV